MLLFNCQMQEVEIEEKVDVIISEWMGYALLYEVKIEVSVKRSNLFPLIYFKFFFVWASRLDLKYYKVEA